MFGSIFKEKRSKPVTIDIFLDHSIFHKFKAFAENNNVDEASAFVQVLERGMTNYWLQEYKHLKQNYLPMKKLFEGYKKDNENFKAIEKQNEQLQKILEENNPKSIMRGKT